MTFQEFRDEIENATPAIQERLRRALLAEFPNDAADVFGDYRAPASALAAVSLAVAIDRELVRLRGLLDRAYEENRVEGQKS